MRHLPLILVGVLLNAVAQLLLKQGMKAIGSFGLDTSALTAVAPRVLTSPYVWGGLFCYVVSVLVWLVVLSRVDVSFAYPMISLGYVFATIIAAAFMHESVSQTRLAGVIVICLGVYLIARTG
jgi:drug/metabolite transporter (DMT)-like permease